MTPLELSREEVDRQATEAVSAARNHLEVASPWYVEQHRKGLEAAILEGDYKAILAFTDPLVARVWPTKSGSINATQITINLSSRQQEDLSLAAPELLPAEIVEDPPLPQ